MSAFRETESSRAREKETGRGGGVAGGGAGGERESSRAHEGPYFKARFGRLTVRDLKKYISLLIVSAFETQKRDRGERERGERGREGERERRERERELQERGFVQRRLQCFSPSPVA